ncbi:hypothetical protein HZB78_05465 [Candidatus Collierbacteria bacterium]|nr:hypothetical protein [Candidatus Collierbacteria bacterium]
MKFTITEIAEAWIEFSDPKYMIKGMDVSEDIKPNKIIFIDCSDITITPYYRSDFVTFLILRKKKKIKKE